MDSLELIARNTGYRTLFGYPPLRVPAEDKMKLLDISTPKFPNTFVKIDDEDFEWASQWKWKSAKTRTNHYCDRTPWDPKQKKYYSLLLHREIFKRHGKCIRSLEIDHVNGNGLDNQKTNLRTCTRSQNMMNMHRIKTGKSKYKGVSWNTKKGKWQIRIMVESVYKSIGYTTDEKEGAILYNAHAKKYFKEFACLNKI